MCLCIASLQELRLHALADVRIVEDGLQVTLYARYGSLQFVGYVLGELSLQYVLFLLGVLQPFVYLDDFFGNLSQLVVRKLYEVFRLEALVVIGTVGKGA